MNKWKEAVKIIIKTLDNVEITPEEQILLDDAKCYYWMYPILLKRAEKKIKRRDKWKLVAQKQRSKY